MMIGLCIMCINCTEKVGDRKKTNERKRDVWDYMKQKGFSVKYLLFHWIYIVILSHTSHICTNCKWILYFYLFLAIVINPSSTCSPLDASIDWLMAIEMMTMTLCAFHANDKIVGVFLVLFSNALPLQLKGISSDTMPKQEINPQPMWCYVANSTLARKRVHCMYFQMLAIMNDYGSCCHPLVPGSFNPS